jgi:hypothetical protein
MSTVLKWMLYQSVTTCVHLIVNFSSRKLSNYITLINYIILLHALFICNSSVAAEMIVTELHNLHISELWNCKHAEKWCKISSRSYTKLHLMMQFIVTLKDFLAVTIKMIIFFFVTHCNLGGVCQDFRW